MEEIIFKGFKCFVPGTKASHVNGEVSGLDVQVLDLDGSVYRGHWDARKGPVKGKLVACDAAFTYEGNFLNYRANGLGRAIYRDKSICTAVFAKGYPGNQIKTQYTNGDVLESKKMSK